MKPIVKQILCIKPVKYRDKHICLATSNFMQAVSRKCFVDYRHRQGTRDGPLGRCAK